MRPPVRPEARSEAAPAVYRILESEAVSLRETPFGAVGGLFAGSGIEVVWVRKRAEQIDSGWFAYHETDVIVVLQGQLKVEFESPVHHDRILEPGDALVLPPRCRCRAYRWPRTAERATVFLAVYPTSAARHSRSSESVTR